VRNGVDTKQLYGTLDALAAQPGLGAFRFHAENHWIDGAHNRTTIAGFHGSGQDVSRARAFVLDAGEPTMLLGEDTGPSPVEAVLHALAACLTTSLVYVAAARKVQLTEVRSTLEGELDVRGCLGLADDVPNGLQAIRVRMAVTGDAAPAVLVELVERARQRSAVYDTRARGVPVAIGVATG